jgi:hypothetical protein
MNHATVFWRIDHDDFIITEVTFIEGDEGDDGFDISAAMWVEMAIREEARLNGYTEEELNEELKVALESFELLAVIKGKVEYYF